MVANLISILTLAAACSAATLPKPAKIQFDGRIPKGTPLKALDVENPWFNPGYVKGANLNWSQIIQFPTVSSLSLFDRKEKTIPLEVTISDKSIFAPSATYSQPGFRRADLLPASNSGTDNSTVGFKTLHFSLRKDLKRPLNTSHEYQLVWLETNDYSTNQFALKYGTIYGREKTPEDKDVLILQSNVRDPVDIFKVKFKPNGWLNFGLVLDFTKNTTQVLYSEDSQPLRPVTKVLPNDLSGQGQYHFGILKKPTAIEGVADITQGGYQPPNINEGVVFGGIFQEDARVSLV